ncbi:MAG: hypothetical protein ACK4LT_03080 [Aquificaceae bacterium]
MEKKKNSRKKQQKKKINWPEYDRALVKRGELILWLSAEVVAQIRREISQIDQKVDQLNQKIDTIVQMLTDSKKG